MPIQYKIDVLTALKGAGYSSYRLRKDKILSERTIQSIRNGTMVSYETLARICGMLNCQPGDILEYTKQERSDASQDD